MKLISGAQLRQFKAQAQRLEPMFKIGQAGLSEGFVQAVNAALQTHEVVKVKFLCFKDQKDELAEKLANDTVSQLIQRVGNVAVLCRPKLLPSPANEAGDTPASPTIIKA